MAVKKTPSTKRNSKKKKEFDNSIIELAQSIKEEISIEEEIDVNTPESIEEKPVEEPIVEDIEKFEKSIEKEQKPKRKRGMRKIPERFLYNETPQSVKTKEEEKVPTPITITEGISPLNAIFVKSSEKEVSNKLYEIFGQKDGSFYILNENTTTRTIQGQRKKIKSILVEDENKFRYFLWFDLTNTSLLRGLKSY